VTGPEQPRVGADRPQDSAYDPEQVVVRDKRRIDPDTGQTRPGEPSPAADAAGEAPAAQPQDAQPQGVRPEDVQPQDDQPQDDQPQDDRAQDEPGDRVAELTGDLQRLSAEYANYRKRVERDRLAVVEAASASLLAQLLPLLDDVDRARQHGDLTGGFKGVGEALEALTERLGLERYGVAGEPFDPQVHEAVMQAEPDASSDVPVCAAVFAPGFRVHGRVLRAAQVSVAEAGAAAPAGGQE